LQKRKSNQYISNVFAEHQNNIYYLFIVTIAVYSHVISDLEKV